ncbi:MULTISPECIES: ThiF family adenylyltransferase [Agrobacterium]|uniref:ThiF family adenylyltransferase n=1 Tax=Agrobacterium TaxID=357 RepID=UPI002301A124|nr:MULTISPECIES: ThiF family adenylyltransferase [Agrobacterium]MDA5641317.1 ThiF family adenylyltransferase [Agrobacterium sp. ST15.13.013]MDA7001493.1 ThiF family adenylyltransferase [Agrobacterium salinitolerans]
MMPERTLAMAGVTHAILKAHLLSDGNEAAAILICAPSRGPRQRLVVRQVLLVPHEACPVRKPDAIVWPGAYIEDAIDIAEPEGLVIILLHSHPGGWLQFSRIDNESDTRVVPGLFEAFGYCHGSAIMTPEGAIRARLYASDMTSQPVDLVTIAGDDISYWWNDRIVNGVPAGRPLAFTGTMTEELSRLSAAVIGVSGTGSISAEQVARLGFGSVILVDQDKIEKKNLNRILNSTLADAEQARPKVEMFSDAIAAHRGDRVAVSIADTLGTRKAIEAVGQCDVIFCCVDSKEGRQYADLIAAAFLIPLFDVGVTIPTFLDEGKVAIADVSGRIDYVQPGGSTLSDRGVYTQESLRAEYLQRTDPAAFQDELAAGYIKGIHEEAPSVITLNMRAASALVNEFIARAYPYRQEPNRKYSRVAFSLAACDEDYYAEDDFDRTENASLGRGSAEPLLGLPLFRKPRKAAA